MWIMFCLDVVIFTVFLHGAVKQSVDNYMNFKHGRGISGRKIILMMLYHLLMIYQSINCYGDIFANDFSTEAFNRLLFLMIMYVGSLWAFDKRFEVFTIKPKIKITS